MSEGGSADDDSLFALSRSDVEVEVNSLCSRSVAPSTSSLESDSLLEPYAPVAPGGGTAAADALTFVAPYVASADSGSSRFDSSTSSEGEAALGVDEVELCLDVLESRASGQGQGPADEAVALWATRIGRPEAADGPGGVRGAVRGLLDRVRLGTSLEPRRPWRKGFWLGVGAVLAALSIGTLTDLRCGPEALEPAVFASELAGLAGFAVSACLLALFLDHGGRFDKHRALHRIGFVYAVLALVGRSDIFWINHLACHSNRTDRPWALVLDFVAFNVTVLSAGGVVLLALRKLADLGIETARCLRAALLALFLSTAMFLWCGGALFLGLSGFAKVNRGSELFASVWVVTAVWVFAASVRHFLLIAAGLDHVAEVEPGLVPEESHKLRQVAGHLRHTAAAVTLSGFCVVLLFSSVVLVSHSVQDGRCNFEMGCNLQWMLASPAALVYWIACLLETAVNGGCVVLLLGLVGPQVEAGLQPQPTEWSWTLLEQAARPGTD
jgi:hypothetical protein